MQELNGAFDNLTPSEKELLTYFNELSEVHIDGVIFLKKGSVIYFKYIINDKNIWCSYYHTWFNHQQKYGLTHAQMLELFSKIFKLFIIDTEFAIKPSYAF